MGREAYLMRLALGRSALDPPEDSETFTAARAGGYTSALHLPGESDAPTPAPDPNVPQRDVQLYDARGHPFNPWARARSRKLREAQNDILSVIGVTERKNPVLEDASFLGGGSEDLPNNEGHEVDPDENEAGDFIGTAADFDYQFLSWWVHALTNRLLVFPPSDGLSFRDVVRMQWRGLGWREFMFGGLSPFMLGHVVSPELWTGKILYVIDRAVLSSVSSRKWRDWYENVRFAIAGSIEVALNVFVLPFRLHSMLQLLGFAPASSWLGLPHPRSWLPFCGFSLIQLKASTIPLLPFFLFRPLSSLVHQYIFMSLRPTIMGPLDIGHRRRSSSSRYAASVNAAPLLELPTDPTVLTSTFQRIFSSLRWSPPLPPSSTRSAEPPFGPTLRRRETWPVEAHAAPASDIDEPAPEEQPNDTLPPPTPFPREQSPPPQNQQPPPLTRVNTVATLDGSGSPSHENDATIRVSSIDPDTGAVNLEIGLPEETTLLYESQELVLHDDDDNLHLLDAMAGEMRSRRNSSRRRRDEVDLLYTLPHHVSRLALEPTELLASLSNGWVSGWVLLPIRAWVLRGLVGYVLRSPEVFGVDPSRAVALPGLLGSQGVARGWAGDGLKHVALSSLLDVSLGLAYWIAEYAVVRYVGVESFAWGTF